MIEQMKQVEIRKQKKMMETGLEYFIQNKCPGILYTYYW